MKSLEIQIMKNLVRTVKILFIVAILLGIYSCGGVQKGTSVQSDKPYAIVIHGGAGYIKNLPPEIEKKYREALQKALNAGYAVLENGGSALDAVETAVRIMEDDSLFNAGRGSVLNHLGQVEMDASIMDGKTLNAGAVTLVKHIKNPVSAARLVMDSSRHVMMAGDGAEQFVKQFGLEMKPQEYFILERRKRQLQRMQSKDKQAFYGNKLDGIRKYGTVGCVALDKQGHLAAATSTGGLMNKQYGRIGDSPIIGAGTYADNQTCAVSATGTGEFFIRTNAAFRVSALMKYNGLNLQDALKQTLKDIERLGGDGGLIGIDKSGNISWYFNTEGMFRAYKRSTGEVKIEMYGTD
jgi:beta-aspartyl-peptidase (threonine type)